MLQVYTFASLTSDIELGKTAWEAMSALEFDWSQLKKLVDSEDNFDPQGAEDLVRSHFLDY